MLAPLELKRLKLQLIQVSAAKADLEFQIDSRLEDIERIKTTIKIQEEKEQELTAKISAEENPA